MSASVEYHIAVRPLRAASFLLLGLCAAPILLSTSHAQINGAPASVTSPNFGGHAINGTAPSVTSVGPRGYAPGTATFETGTNRNSSGDGHHHGDGRNDNGRNDSGHHHHRQQDYGYVPYLYAVPYAVDMNGDGDNRVAADDPAEDDAQYEGGPTVFDRRGTGADSYIPPARDIAPRHAAHSADADADPPEPEQPLEPTLLVFKDGRTTEVANYAILGATLFDLTPGHHRKIAISDLDLDATEKQNDERGVTFRIPSPSRGN